MVLVGLKVAVVGMLVVFFGLLILITCISVMHALMTRKTEKPAAAPAAAAPAPAPAAPRTYVPGPELKQGSPELYAVLTAAVSAEMQKKGVNPEGGFKITSVKPM
ncbi:MAG: OadG family protein [Candidatus Aphodomonas sp.]|nr:OadG family protein [Candidatus Aphodomonas sp.]